MLNIDDADNLLSMRIRKNPILTKNYAVLLVANDDSIFEISLAEWEEYLSEGVVKCRCADEKNPEKLARALAISDCKLKMQRKFEVRYLERSLKFMDKSETTPEFFNANRVGCSRAYNAAMRGKKYYVNKFEKFSDRLEFLKNFNNSVVSYNPR